MNWMPLLGIIAIFYALFVVYVALRKPDSMWDMKKIKTFRKVLGDQGTVIFFIIWGILFGGLGIWLMTL